MHSDGTGVLMICRLSLRAAQKWAPSSYTGRRSLLSPQPTRMGLSPRDKDSGNFVLGSEVLGECSTALCLHFTLRKETPPLWGAPRWTPAHILMSSWSLIWHVQAAALELGREGLSLGILLWMALVRKAGREMEMKIKMDIARTSTERLTKAEVFFFCCVFVFGQMLLERNMQLRKKISPLVIWFSFWTSFCFLFKLRTGVKYCRSHEFLPLMEATSGAFSLGSPLGPGQRDIGLDSHMWPVQVSHAQTSLVTSLSRNSFPSYMNSTWLWATTGLHQEKLFALGVQFGVSFTIP